MSRVTPKFPQILTRIVECHVNRQGQIVENTQINDSDNEIGSCAVTNHQNLLILLQLEKVM